MLSWTRNPVDANRIVIWYVSLASHDSSAAAITEVVSEPAVVMRSTKCAAGVSSSAAPPYVYEPWAAVVAICM